jgi:hypothetical protein
MAGTLLFRPIAMKKIVLVFTFTISVSQSRILKPCGLLMTEHKHSAIL